MRIIEWESKFDTGITRVDYQHRNFLQLIKYIQFLDEDSAPQGIINKALAELIHYVHYHFNSEENIMRICNYPDIEEHEVKHLALIENLSNEISKYEIQEIELSGLIDFLHDWFINHTVHEDRKFSKHILDAPEYKRYKLDRSL